MEIREADTEHCYIDKGEEISCPVCGAAWLTLIEDDVDIDSCEHLRFSLNSDRDEDFDIFEEWNSNSFIKMVRDAREKDDEADILEILNKIHHPDIDAAFLYVWRDDPLNHPWMLWGYGVS